MKNIILTLGYILMSTQVLAAEYKGGFCRVQRAAAADQPDSANLSWLKLECFNGQASGKATLAKGQTDLKEMFVPARHVPRGGVQVSRGYPSHLVIDGQIVSNDGPNGLDYFDVISGYGKTIEDCKKKFLNLSCKHIGIILQPGAGIYEKPNNQGFGTRSKKANEQFLNEDFVQACAVEGCGRRNVAVAPPAIPTKADLKPTTPVVVENQTCVTNQAKFEALQNKSIDCLSGFQSNQFNAKAMYKTIAQYLSCEKFDFVSAEVKQEGTHQVSVNRDPASVTGCEIKIPIDIDASLGYGKISFKDKSNKTVDVDWDSRFDSSNSANSEVYWKNDFGKKLMATLNTSGSGAATPTQPAAPAGGNQ